MPSPRPSTRARPTTSGWGTNVDTIFVPLIILACIVGLVLVAWLIVMLCLALVNLTDWLTLKIYRVLDAELSRKEN
jgi:hypothetical protein